MNDYSLNDPQLQSLEARLAARVPQVSRIQQQQLLYQCAFAAGQTASGRSLRRWQAVAAALVALLLGMSVPLAHDRCMLAKQTVEPFVRTEESSPKSLVQSRIPITVRQPATVELDAWQMRQSDRASFAEELVHFQQTDPHLRSLAVGTLTRAVLNP